MIEQVIAEVLQPLAVFGGIALVIMASARAKLEHRKLDMMRGQPPVAPEAAQAGDRSQDGAVLAELKALKQQMAEMNSTSHAFDLSFDEALNRMEGRVGRLETKSAARSAAAEDAPAVQRNGSGAGG